MEPEPVVSRLTFCREAFKTARVLPVYPLQLTINERRLRLLAEWELAEAAKLTRAAGLDTPCARPTT